MKKKIVLLSVGCVFAMATAITASCIALSNNNGLFHKFANATEDYYTITILPGDVDTVLPYQSGSETPCHNGTAEHETDQNHNPVHLSFEHMYCDSFNDTAYMRFFGPTSGIYNTESINSMVKIKIWGQSTYDLSWGWKEEGVITYYDARKNISPDLSGTEYDFGGYNPNFFMLRPTSDSVRSISKIVISLDKSCTVSENPFEVYDGVKYAKYGESAYAVAGFLGAQQTNLVLRNTINDLPVTRINDDAFRDCEEIETVTLPSQLEEVGRYAFYSCNNIESLVIPNTVTSIGYLGFGDLSNCTNLSFQAGGTSLLSISQAAFRNTGHVGVLTMPSRVGSMSNGGGGTFYGENITAFALNDDNVVGNVISVDERGALFSSEYGKTLVSYPSGNTNTTYTLPADVIKLLDSEAFYGAKYLEEVTLINTGALRCGSYTFYNMPELRKVNFNGTGTTTLYWYTFSACPKLLSMVIPETVVCEGRGLAEIGTSDKHASLFLMASDIPDNWSDQWCFNDVTNDYTSVYFYSASEPATEEAKLTHWHYVDDVPTPWAIRVHFTCYRTDIGDGYAFYLLGTFNEWTANETSRGTFNTDHWEITLVLQPNVTYQFKGAISTWDSPTSITYEVGSNRSWTPDSLSYNYNIDWHYS